VQQHLPLQDIEKCLSVQAPSSSNNDTFKVAIAVQQIMTELIGAMSEKDKIMVITKIVLNIMKQNGCYSS
jgi:phage terminase large subunit-like protein